MEERRHIMVERVTASRAVVYQMTSLPLNSWQVRRQLMMDERIAAELLLLKTPLLSFMHHSAVLALGMGLRNTKDLIKETLMALMAESQTLRGTGLCAST